MKYEEVVERLNEAEQKVKEGELLRRKLHNTILVKYRNRIYSLLEVC